MRKISAQKITESLKMRKKKKILNTAEKDIKKLLIESIKRIK